MKSPNSIDQQSLAHEEVDKILAALPPDLRTLAKGVAVHCPRLPNQELTSEFGEDLLGLFSGEAYAESGETLLPIPPQIHLFTENLWEEAEGDLTRFKTEVRITYLHELGHYLGWDEEEIERRGLG